MVDVGLVLGELEGGGPGDHAVDAPEAYFGVDVLADHERTCP